ncbi:DUF4328 domain-containing protein [Streptomyces sp. NPDC047028]|uniref:DUF4328 domain-containing protein n=1 Tax=Streptomyces sp. NPDC047028 TaxID=3155793 RepID=UPI0033F7E415
MNDQIAQSLFRPTRSAGRMAVGTLLLAGLGYLLRAVWEIRLAAAGEPASGPPDQGEGVHRPLTALEDSYHFVATVTGVLTAVCAICFLAWLRRVRENAADLSGCPPKYSGLWVYLGWIVPVVNLWFPRGIVADAFRTTAPGRRLPASVSIWWALWLTSLVTGIGLIYSASTDEIIARAYSSIWPLLASDAATIGAAAAGALAVRAVTSAQLACLAGDEAATPPEWAGA